MFTELFIYLWFYITIFLKVCWQDPNLPGEYSQIHPKIFTYSCTSSETSDLKGLCVENFKGPSMQRCQCPKWYPKKLSLINYELDINVYIIENNYF